jgi:DNA ligase (NAD+)
VTLFNAKFVETMGIGPGAKIMIKRSGQVIPFVISVTKTANNNLPSVCPSCKEKVEWNENCVELICTNDDCTSKRLNKIISFFDILGVENVGEGIFTQLYETRYDTVAKILNMAESDFRKLEGFGDRKAEIAYNAIHEKMQNVSLSKLQHASGCFKLLGSKKLILLEEFYGSNPTVDGILLINGFAEKSAEDYLQGIKKFKEFIKNLPITIKKESKMELLENRLVGQSFCITGTLSQPRTYFEELIQNYGGVVKGVSSKLNYLVVGTDPGSKVQKADNGFTRIINESEFMELIG